jgi:hypothetical protein
VSGKLNFALPAQIDGCVDGEIDPRTASPSAMVQW